MDKPNRSLNSDDLKSIEDWIDYYCILYNKSRKKKYLDKVTDLINRLKDTEKIVILNRRGDFEDAFMSALGKRIKKDMDLKQDIEKAVLIEGNAFIEISGTGKIKEDADGNTIIESIEPDGLKIISSQKVHDDFLKQIKKEKEDGSE